MKRRICLLSITLLTLTGCFPYHFTMRPGARGHVVDAQTRTPVAGARLTILKVPFESPAVALDPIAVLSATTDADGAFAVAPEKHWGIYIVPMDMCSTIRTCFHLLLRGLWNVAKRKFDVEARHDVVES